MSSEKTAITTNKTRIARNKVSSRDSVRSIFSDRRAYARDRASMRVAAPSWGFVNVKGVDKPLFSGFRLEFLVATAVKWISGVLKGIRGLLPPFRKFLPPLRLYVALRFHYLLNQNVCTS